MPLIAVKPPTIPITAPTWSEVTLIFRHKSGRVETSDGWQYGTLVVHPALPDEASSPPVVITHKPSLIAVVRMDDADLAIKAVERMWAECRAAWLGETCDKAKVPPDVVTWIKGGCK